MKISKLAKKILLENKHLFKEQNEIVDSNCMDPNAFNFVSNANTDCVGEQQPGVVTGLLGFDWEIFNQNNEFGDTCCCQYVQDAYLNGIYTPNYAEPANNQSVFDTTCGEYELYVAIEGCIDPGASNYNPDATVDDGSCNFIFSTDTSPATTGIAVCYKCQYPKNVVSQKFPYDTKEGKDPCPKGWTLNPDPCPPSSLAVKKLTCYKCHPDGQTILSQDFPQIDEKGCPSGWSLNQDPCSGLMGDLEGGTSTDDVGGGFPDDGGTINPNADLIAQSTLYGQCPPGEICGCTNPDASNYDPNATYDPLLYIDDAGIPFPDHFFLNSDPNLINGYPYGELNPNNNFANTAGSCEYDEFDCSAEHLDAWINVFLWEPSILENCPPGQNCGYVSLCHVCSQWYDGFIEDGSFGNVLSTYFDLTAANAAGLGMEDYCECCRELGIHYNDPPDVFNDVFYGCTDEEAINFSPTANVDNGSCIYQCDDYGYPGFYNVPCKTITLQGGIDIDGDGILNDTDPDVDGDGIPNEEDPDIDGDGIPNDTDDTPSGFINTFDASDFTLGPPQDIPIMPDGGPFLKLFAQKGLIKNMPKSRVKPLRKSIRERLQKLAGIKKLLK
tara:strand:+ start:2926 stop:4758 length:1833 start_codon:yes stop_codon:yes gene_type:complete